MAGAQGPPGPPAFISDASLTFYHHSPYSELSSSAFSWGFFHSSFPDIILKILCKLFKLY